MTNEELKEWNDTRLRLFAGAKLPPHTLAAILHDARRLDFDTAMRALPIYRAARPYRGFYPIDWARHYDQARRADGRTEVAQERAPAAVDEGAWREESKADQRREIDAYRRLSTEQREAAATALAGWGYQPSDSSRAWRFIAVAWTRGEDVGRYRLHRDLDAGPPERGYRTRAEQIDDAVALREVAQSRIDTLMAMGEQ
jgi:hypothetical protein